MPAEDIKAQLNMLAERINKYQVRL